MTENPTRRERLGRARTAKKDEFYTLLPTIEEELGLYLDLDPDLLRGKTILLPADDPESSNFTQYCVLNQHILGWDRLVSTSFNAEGRGKVLDVRADRMSEARVELLDGNGDFAGEEVTRFRDEADFVFTNPPFSLFRKFWAWLFEGDVQFSVIGNLNAVTYKDVFPHLQRGEAWLGGHRVGSMEFQIPDQYPLSGTQTRMDELGNRFVKVTGVRWFTNIDFASRYIPIPLEQSYVENPEKYPRYDNHNSIEVSRVKDIPKDFYGLMGVPITFLDRWDPEQFDVVWGFNSGPSWEKLGASRVRSVSKSGKELWTSGPVVNGEAKYFRVVIARRG